jgi:transposase-like protein
MTKRRTHNPELKARVALEALAGRRTIQEIAAEYALHPIQVSQWKKQLSEGAQELFANSRRTQNKEKDQQQRESQLYEQIGKLQMELAWLKKKGGFS